MFLSSWKTSLKNRLLNARGSKLRRKSQRTNYCAVHAEICEPRVLMTSVTLSPSVDQPFGSVLNNAYPGVSISNVDFVGDTRNFGVINRGVFAPSSVSGNWFAPIHTLQFRLAEPTSEFTVGVAAATSNGDRAFIRYYSSSLTQLGSVGRTLDTLNAFQDVTVTRNSADIKYILVTAVNSSGINATNKILINKLTYDRTGPEVSVGGLGNLLISDGDTSPRATDGTDFGTVSIQDGSTLTRSFTVSNTGNETLTTSSLSVPSGYTVTDTLSNSIAPGSSDTFSVRLDATTMGTKSGQISFTTNDSDENPYNFSITGSVVEDDSTVPKQVVSAANTSAAAGQAVQIPVQYTTTDSDNTLSTLGFRLHYDSTKLQFGGLSNVFQTFFVQQQDQADASNLDGDAATDRFVLVAWSDFVNGQFPNQPLPLTLYKANFTVAAGLNVGTTSVIRFTDSATALTHSFLGSPVTVTVQPTVNLDVDGDGTMQVASDGFLILRYMLGFTGSALTTGVLGAGATRTNPSTIIEFLDGGRTTMLDVDADGTVQVASDGFLTLRYMLGFTGAALTNGVLPPGATRTDPAAIIAFLDTFRPQSGSSSLSQSMMPRSAALQPATSTPAVQMAVSVPRIDDRNAFVSTSNLEVFAGSVGDSPSSSRWETPAEIGMDLSPKNIVAVTSPDESNNLTLLDDLFAANLPPALDSL